MFFENSKLGCLNTDRLAQLFKKMDPDCPERPVFISRAVKWTITVDQSHTRGHPDLHQKLGIIFWEGIEI